MPRDDSAFLLDMLIAAREALAFTKGATSDEFSRNRQLQLSILKSVEIVGEAAARVDEHIKQANPAIPWPKIVGTHNRPTSMLTCALSGKQQGMTCGL